MIYVLTAVR